MIQLFKVKSLKKTRKSLTSNVEEKSQEKVILKEGIGVNGKLTCTKRAGTRGFSFATYTPSKMTFAASGRSMVEMLGVLAIIGVLSIGGIQGYTMAMRRYKANEILSSVNKYATTIWTLVQKRMMDNPDLYVWKSHTYLENTDDEFMELYLSKPGEYEYSLHGIYDFIETIPAFSDLGLGEMPTGLKNIYFEGIGMGKSGTGINFTLSFDNQGLCETVLAMSDFDRRHFFLERGESADIDSSLCVDNWGGPYYTRITIYAE